MPTAAKTPAKKTAKKAAKKSAKKTAKASNKGNPCWPGFEPTPGKKPMTKGSCKPAS